MHEVHSLSIGTHIEKNVYTNFAICNKSCLFQPVVFATLLALQVLLLRALKLGLCIVLSIELILAY